jgi:hypothetical protein
MYIQLPCDNDHNGPRNTVKSGIEHKNPITHMYIDIMHIKLLTLKDTQETNLKHLKILLPADSTTTSGGSTKYNGKAVIVTRIIQSL